MNNEINGNFELALIRMIQSLIERKKSYGDILYEWDKTRGNDWFTSTKLMEQRSINKGE